MRVEDTQTGVARDAQYSSTVKWWYQWRKITSFFWITRNTVSMSSGTLLKMKSIVHRPAAPWPKAVSAGAHTDS